MNRPRRPVGPLAVFALSLCAAAPALADENFFGYSYGSETLPRGRNEAYVWLTRRAGKGIGDYTAWDNFNELEHGFSDRLQASLYVNTSAHHIKGNPEWADVSSFGFEGVRTSFKYALTSPYKDGIGVALYIEPELSRRHKISGQERTELALENKLILQKNFRDDTIVTVLNLTYEHEFEKEEEEHESTAAAGAEEEEWEQEIALEATVGVSYRFRPSWFLGLEGRTHSEYPGADLGNQEHRAWFLGPTLHYGGKKWWFTVTVLPQVVGVPHENSDHLFLGEHEKLETRLKVGYNF
jgi:hypothetical protein